jgi:hypothetical protein
MGYFYAFGAGFITCLVLTVIVIGKIMDNK